MNIHVNMVQATKEREKRRKKHLICETEKDEEEEEEMKYTNEQIIGSRKIVNHELCRTAVKVLFH